VFLLPIAERHRRSLLLGLLLAALLLQSWMQWGPLQALGRTLVAPVAAVIMPLAGQVVDRVDPRRAPTTPGLASTTEFVQLEREQGRPAELPGVAWLEIPVFEYRRSEHRLVLAAGSNYGLAVGMPVVFGSTWLGRLSQVHRFSAVVQLCSAAGVPTGAYLPVAATLGQEDANAGALRAVVEGRGREGVPLLRWMESQAEPKEGGDVLWRATMDDLPGLGGLGLELGTAEFTGDVQRGAGYWQVIFEMPAGAEGRVFVPAGAIAKSTVAEPQIDHSPAQLALRVDGVFGAELCGLRTLKAEQPSVVLDGNRVLGKVVAHRGNLLWCSLQPPKAWSEESLRLSDLGMVDPDPVQLFTRGDATVPRGLPLGATNAAAPVPGAEFWALTRVPLPSEEQP
jgi:hypothetical protein